METKEKCFYCDKEVVLSRYKNGNVDLARSQSNGVLVVQAWNGSFVCCFGCRDKAWEKWKMEKTAQ